MIKIIELGPFGSRIERGYVDDINEIPEGYVVRSQTKNNGSPILYIELCAHETKESSIENKNY